MTKLGWRTVLAIALLGPSEAGAGERITKGPWVQRVTKDSAVVRVEVEPPAAVSLEWGRTPGVDGGSQVLASSEIGSLHTFPLSGLVPGSHYAVAVRTTNSTKTGEFVTAPEGTSDAPFRFLAYGDNRSDQAAHAAVVRAMTSVPSDFLIHTGDFVEVGDSPAEWQTFFDVEAPLLGARCLFSAVGNHELTDGAGIQYARFFGPTDLPALKDGRTVTRPEHLDGTVRWGSARFFFINGMVSYRDTVDRSWLERALAAADDEPDLRWRIVVVHHGPWSSGPHGNNARLHDAGIVSLLMAHKVDLVLSGHDHLYERGIANGLAYVVTGGGGAPVYKVRQPGPFSKKVESVRHFLDVGVTPASMQLAAIRLDGSLIERCSLTKGGWDCDGARGEPSSSPAAAPTPAAAPPSPPAASSSRCSCDLVAKDASSSGNLLAGSVVVGLAWRRRGTRTKSLSQ